MAMQMIGSVMSHDEKRRARVSMETRQSVKGPRFIVETQSDDDLRWRTDAHWDLFSATEAATKFVKGE